MRIGQIAKETCVSPSILRYYETIGLIPHPGRDDSGYRAYSEAEVERIRLVVGARSLGIPVADIREILEIQDLHSAPCPRLMELLDRKTQEVDVRIARLKALRSDLQRLRAMRTVAVESTAFLQAS